MSRPLRIEFPGALYHVTARGNEKKTIYLSRADFNDFLKLLGKVCKRYNWTIHAYCLMLNHYHLLVETPDANLSAGMAHLNGVYAKIFNYRHHRVGHLYQGRFHAVLVDKDSYLMELNRYIVLNPVRANIVSSAEKWFWSNYQDTIGQRESQEWLATDEMLRFFGNTRIQAIKNYQKFVQEGLHENPWDELKQKLYLGSDEFVKQQQLKIDSFDKALTEIQNVPKESPPIPIENYISMYPTRDEAIVAAYNSGRHSMPEIGKKFGIHYSTVSRIISKDR